MGSFVRTLGWLQTLGRDHPDEANKIVAMTAKLFNQNETREWIRTTGVNGLNPNKPFRIPGTRESYGVTLNTDGSVTTRLVGRGYRIAPDGSRSGCIASGQ